MARRLGLVALGVVLAVTVAWFAGWWRSQLGTSNDASPRPIEPESPQAPTLVEDAPIADAATRLRTDAFGVIWTPAPGDAELLDSGALRLVGTLDATRTRGFGLEVRVAGEASIGLASELGSRRFEAELDATGFDGTWTLALGLDEADEIAIVHTPDARLVLRSGPASSPSILATGNEPRPEGPFVLALSILGRQVGGSVDGERIVEAHLDEIPSGQRIWGLKLDGHGTVRIRRLQASSLAE